MDTRTTTPGTAADPTSAAPCGGRRALRFIGVALAGLLFFGVVVEAGLAARDERAHPAPGELVELADGRHLHVDVTTRGTDGPTIVLEAGAGIPSSLWRPTVDALLETIDGPVTVVAYDRAGSAWSGPVGRAPTPEVVVDDLREALALQRLQGPYVLVGHSIGGHYVRTFAATHADEVAGAVLVDPRHEDAATRLPELGEAQAQTTRMLRWGVRLRPFGITRLVHQPSAQLPADIADQVYALELHRHHLRGSLALGETLDRIDAHVARHGTDLGDVPVRIVSAGHIPDDDPLARDLADILDELHRELRSLSTDGTRHVIADADHLSIVTDPTHARELATHIADLLDTAR